MKMKLFLASILALVGAWAVADEVMIFERTTHPGGFDWTLIEATAIEPIEQKIDRAQIAYEYGESWAPGMVTLAALEFVEIETASIRRSGPTTPSLDVINAYDAAP